MTTVVSTKLKSGSLSQITTVVDASIKRREYVGTLELTLVASGERSRIMVAKPVMVLSKIEAGGVEDSGCS